MRLPEYLSAVNETQKAFATRSGSSHRTISRICAGEPCSLVSAVKIIRACHARPSPTGGVVTFEELVPLDEGNAA